MVTALTTTVKDGAGGKIIHSIHTRARTNWQHSLTITHIANMQLLLWGKSRYSVKEEPLGTKTDDDERWGGGGGGGSRKERRSGRCRTMSATIYRKCWVRREGGEGRRRKGEMGREEEGDKIKIADMSVCSRRECDKRRSCNEKCGWWTRLEIS